MGADLAVDGTGASGSAARDCVAAAARAPAAPASVAGDAEVIVAAPPAAADHGSAISSKPSPTPTAQNAAAAPFRGIPTSQAVQQREGAEGAGALMSEANGTAAGSKAVPQDEQQDVQQDVLQGSGQLVRAEKSPSAWLAQQALAAGAFSHGSTRDASSRMMKSSDVALEQPAGPVTSDSLTSERGSHPSAGSGLVGRADRRRDSDGDVGVDQAAAALVSNVWRPTGLSKQLTTGKPGVGSEKGGPPSKAAKVGGGSAPGARGQGDGWEGGLVKPKVRRATDTCGQKEPSTIGQVALSEARDRATSEGKPSASDNRHTRQSKVEQVHTNIAFLSRLHRGVQDAMQGSYARLFPAILNDGHEQSRSSSK